MGLGAATQMEEKVDQGLKSLNSLDWFQGRWESCLHITSNFSVRVDMVNGGQARWGRCFRVKWSNQILGELLGGLNWVNHC